jgi:hypothetical protein
LWQDGTTSYHHSSIGGYHGIKLRRYQDLIDIYLSQELQNIIGVLNAKPSSMQVDSVLADQQVLNMLNTKYFILNPASQPLLNQHAMGNAWLVNDFRLVENADEEYLSLGNTDLTRVAVVDKRFENLVSDDLRHDVVAGTVELTDYRPNHLTYQASLDQKSLVVFSDIYYEGGWQATIDGKSAPLLRADYVLRALPVEAGEHTIELSFVFEPFEKGERISLAGSWLVLLVLLGGFGFFIYSRGRGTRTMDMDKN